VAYTGNTVCAVIAGVSQGLGRLPAYGKHWQASLFRQTGKTGPAHAGIAGMGGGFQDMAQNQKVRLDLAGYFNITFIVRGYADQD
jgi:hypothetical protein